MTTFPTELLRYFSNELNIKLTTHDKPIVTQTTNRSGHPTPSVVQLIA